MLGDLIVSIVKACTTLYRWLRPLPEQSALEELTAVPKCYHFSSIDPPTDEQRFNAWSARWHARHTWEQHAAIETTGYKVRERWLFEPGMRHYSPIHKPFAPQQRSRVLIGGKLYGRDGQPIGTVGSFEISIPMEDIDDKIREAIWGNPVPGSAGAFDEAALRMFDDTDFGEPDPETGRSKKHPNVHYIGRSKRNPK